MTSKPTTVEAYVASLPADRREAVNAIRKVFKQHMDPQLREVMNYGMIGYVVPHEVYPAGYHCDPKLPLPYAGVASQKGHLSVYLMGLYVDGSRQESRSDGLTPEARWFQEAWVKAGRKLDMGKACVRFKRIEDVPLDVLGEALRRVSVKAYIERYEAAFVTAAKGAAKTSAKPASRPAPSKPAPGKPARGKKPAAKTIAKKAPAAKTAKKTGSSRAR